MRSSVDGLPDDPRRLKHNDDSCSSSYLLARFPDMTTGLPWHMDVRAVFLLVKSIWPWPATWAWNREKRSSESNVDSGVRREIGRAPSNDPTPTTVSSHRRSSVGGRRRILSSSVTL